MLKLGLLESSVIHHSSPLLVPSKCVLNLWSQFASQIQLNQRKRRRPKSPMLQRKKRKNLKRSRTTSSLSHHLTSICTASRHSLWTVQTKRAKVSTNSISNLTIRDGLSGIFIMISMRVKAISSTFATTWWVVSLTELITPPNTLSVKWPSLVKKEVFKSKAAGYSEVRKFQMDSPKNILNLSTIKPKNWTIKTRMTTSWSVSSGVAKKAIKWTSLNVKLWNGTSDDDI